MPNSTFAQTRHCRGFSLLELAAVLALLSGLVFALLYKTSDVSIQTALQSTDSALKAADEQLRQFAAWNGRLPCPDTDGDGLENCNGSTQKGDLPYRTLKLAAIGYEVGEQGGRALRYGVYRNAAAEADLAVKDERFKPTNADATAYDLGNSNSLDLCTALASASGHAQNDAYLHIAYTDGARAGMAYMLASPGVADADSDGDRYDGLNSTSATGFNAPQTPVSTTYDDTTRGRGLTELHELLHCQVSQRSLNLATNAIALEEENIAFAESNKDSADEGVMMNAVGSALTAWSMAQAAAELSGAMEVQSISAGLLATATATCAIPPFAGCALVPVYTAAVAAAGTGVTLSGLAVGLSGTALALQITSTVFYSDIAKKAGVPETASGGSGITPERVDSAFIASEQSQLSAQTAQDAYMAALAAYLAGPQVEAQNSRDALETEIGKLSGDQESKALDDLYGFPRPEDLDPENPPDESSVILGVEPSIDAWLKSEAVAKQIAEADDFELVDADGKPIKDEDGNPVDLGASAGAAKETAEQRIAEVRQSLVSAGCDGSTPCPLATAYDAHVDAYTKAQEAWNEVDKLRVAAEAAAKKAKGDRDAYGALNCAYNFNMDYDASTSSCKAGAPGSGALNDGIKALCDPSSEAYDAVSCAAVKANPDSTNPDPLTIFSGMDDLVRTLDSKGTVQ
ncbi:prepilin-type N-terminal cleavage/methylation domain-containing protein [Stutzerimonas stutzeri]|uniref:prepilin-type N-terminal cleavage/methylation domain-containing protein n=1 Tax=Stutzerimonas stutzeri TaxID=316 RepID=UPI0015E2EC1C|nr:prepilin-type N-terminal cleavage/methylation domain-containing protein [Stutzerimonas stutzeri]MBA1264288.1 prepilin-type N-terminal cleavage/methylation domain-containing protein [Stutzerimonas stutzeri]